MSDIEDFEDSGEGDSEGSLVDFIVADDSGDECEDSGDSDVDVNSEEDPDDVAEIAQQYSNKMEVEGIVVTPHGVRRSMRASKGRPPARYVDEDYVGLMTEDVGSDIEKLSSSEDEAYDADSEEYKMELEDEEE